MKKFTRRDFMKVTSRLLGFTGLAAIFGPVVAYFYPSNLEETPSDPVFVSKAAELPVGESKTVAFGRYPALVIHTEQGLRAYSAVCTHFACICKWNAEIGQIVCPCHDGYFDPLDGHVLAGPPPTALEALGVEIADGDIYVSAGGES
jgi:Rieske Fe-S protein